jgi:hypothetical protein
MSRGVYYISTGADYVRKAHDSANSLIEKNPDLPIAIATDQSVDKDLFDHVIKIDEPEQSAEDKVRHFEQTPFDETLYLDSHSFVCDRIKELFELLERFDVAGTRPGGISNTNEIRVDAPSSFPEMRTGVVVYRDNNITNRLFNVWNQVYDRHLKSQNCPPTQPSFREALYHTDTAFCILSRKYNCDIRYPGIQHSKAKILTGVGSNKLENAEAINNYTGTRTHVSVTVGSERYVYLNLYKWPHRARHFYLRLTKKGPLSVWKHTLAWLKEAV